MEQIIELQFEMYIKNNSTNNPYKFQNTKSKKKILNWKNNKCGHDGKTHLVVKNVFKYYRLFSQSR